MLKTIKEYIPITSSTGIFGSFQKPVWAVVLPDSEELDRYFLLRYGDRIGNKLIDMYSDSSTGTVTGTNLQALSKMIYDMNDKRWNHLFNAYMVEYNPLENTDFVEMINEANGNVRTIDTENGNTRTLNTTSGNTRTLNTTSTNTQTTNMSTSNTNIVDGETTSTAESEVSSSGSSSGSNSQNNNVYGFNSVSAVGDTTTSGSDSNTTSGSNESSTTGGTTTDTTTTDSGTTSGTVSDSGTEGGTITDSGSEGGTITDSGTEEGTISDNGTHVSEHRKHGNIGITTNVAMLSEHVDFWWKWSFIDYICQDICDIIALSIY